jgi:hypothetical protein
MGYLISSTDLKYVLSLSQNSQNDGSVFPVQTFSVKFVIITASFIILEVQLGAPSSFMFELTIMIGPVLVTSVNSVCN